MVYEQDLMDKNYKAESTIRELRSKLGGLEEEHARMKQEVQTLRKQNAGLDSEYHEQEKLINQLRTRIAVLEQEIKDKEQVLAKSSDHLQSEQDQKVSERSRIGFTLTKTTLKKGNRFIHTHNID